MAPSGLMNVHDLVGVPMMSSIMSSMMSGKNLSMPGWGRGKDSCPTDFCVTVSRVFSRTAGADSVVCVSVLSMALCTSHSVFDT